MLKWFYDTSTSTATRAARCGSLLEGLRSLELADMEEVRWTQGFTWFGPPESNILRPWEMCALLCVWCYLRLSSTCLKGPK
jgi:hypothetical protein